MYGKRYLLAVEVEELTDTGGYLAICPAIPGCHAEGETVTEALANLEDVARVLLELRTEDGLGPPPELKEVDTRDVRLHAEIVLPSR